MSTRAFLNQDFENDDEESDNDFNPGIEAGSDAEDDQTERFKSYKADDRADSDYEKDREPEQNGNPRQKLNGDKSPVPPRVKDRDSTSVGNEGSDEERGQDDKAEDDEGEGEDLNEDDEDDDDEDEDEEDAVTSRPRKRRRRGLNQFFEEEAEVDEDDDELEADEDDVGPEFIQDTHPDDDLPPEADQDDRRHRELDRQRQLEASMDAEKQAAAYKERYGRRTTTALNNSSFVPQNLLMPDVNDPSIWGVKCKPGKEREIVGKIMKKFMENNRSRQPMKICSVFERGNGPMAGYIFVEAKRKIDVDEALNNVPDVYPRSKTNLVPVREMPDLLRVNKSKELEIGGYVRIKRGIYAGDLGMIQDVESNGLEVTVRLVPRLTYGGDEDDRARPPNADNKRKRMNAFGGINYTGPRPPPRLFNESEARKRDMRFVQQNRGLSSRSFTYKNEIYEDGFLIKDFRLQHLITTDVRPTLDEITKLTKTATDGSESLDLQTLQHSINDTSAESSYMPGDEVEVFDGEQKGIVGRTEGVTGNIVSIKVSEGELTGQLVEVPVKALRKRFREGDNVKIIGGSRYRGEVGTVLLIKADRVTISTDTGRNEITVFSKDLREATDSGAASTRTNKFNVQDLVSIDITTIGCVIKADAEAVRVLDQNGSVTSRLESQLQDYSTPKNAVAIDKNGSELRHGDSVKESGGEGKMGTVLHIAKGYVFVHNKLQIENSGIWVARATNVIATAAKGGRITAPSTDLTKMNPALQMRNGPDGSMGPPSREMNDHLKGKHVHIMKGGYKGHKGIVKDTTAGEARIELQSKNKVINVDKNELAIIDHASGKRTPYREWQGRRGGPPTMRTGTGIPGSSRIPDGGFGGRTPMGVMNGGQTPAWGSSSSRTPAWGGVGSSAVDSGRTPTWKAPSGSQTSYGGTGNMTSYGGTANYGASGGSRTPAWSSSARTPYGADHGFSSSNTASSGFDAFAAGSRTPAYGATGTTSRTPAWSGFNNVASAPTPGKPYDAPTPAASAPTPGGRFDEDPYTPFAGGAPTPGPTYGGVNDAPTPGFAKGANKEPLKNSRFDAPTPAATAMTPYGGAYDAPTPAVGGSGPQYVDDDDDE